jgi:hypothetical protein
MNRLLRVCRNGGMSVGIFLGMNGLVAGIALALDALPDSDRPALMQFVRVLLVEPVFALTIAGIGGVICAGAILLGHGRPPRRTQG